jgi:hypothetical protein
MNFLDVGIILFAEREPAWAEWLGLEVDARDDVGGEDEDAAVLELLDELEDELWRERELRSDLAFGTSVDDGSLAVSSTASGV